MKKLMYIVLALLWVGHSNMSYAVVCQTVDTSSNDACFLDTASPVVTDTLFVSPNGDGSDGGSWSTAYTTVQAALDAASTDTADLTLIKIGPHATYYDINTTGDPTWSANVTLVGPEMSWAQVRNTHASATSIMKLTGNAAIYNVTFHLHTASANGLILTKRGGVIHNSGINGSTITGAATGLWLDCAATTRQFDIRDFYILGDGTNLTGILLDNVSSSLFKDVRIYEAGSAIQIVENGGSSDENEFFNIDLGENVIGYNIDAGSGQDIISNHFHRNTTNIDDEVGDHNFIDLQGQEPISAHPATLAAGVSVACGSTADSFVSGGWTELRSAAAATKPFRIVGFISEANATEKFSLQLSADSGATVFDTIIVEGENNTAKRQSAAFPAGTSYIFNKGKQIVAQSKSETGGNIFTVWLKIQEF